MAKSTKALQKETNQLEKFLKKNNKNGKGLLSEFDDLEDLLGNLESELDVLDQTLGFVEGGIEEQEGDDIGVEEEGELEEGVEGMEHVEVSGSSDTIIGKGKQPEESAIEDTVQCAEHVEVPESGDIVSGKGKQPEVLTNPPDTT